MAHSLWSTFPSVEALQQDMASRPINNICLTMLSVGSLSFGGISVPQLLQRLTATIGQCLQVSHKDRMEEVRPPPPLACLLACLLASLLASFLWLGGGRTHVSRK